MLIYTREMPFILTALYYLVALHLLNIHSHLVQIPTYRHPSPNSASPSAVKLKENGIHLHLFLQPTFYSLSLHSRIFILPYTPFNDPFL